MPGLKIKLAREGTACCKSDVAFPEAAAARSGCGSIDFMRKSWDIFCSVIDNYGDIGIAWRLARQLVAEHGLTVRLWVDDLEAFHRIWPEIRRDADIQHACGVEVRAWHGSFLLADPAQVVIEAFGCALPEAYLQAMSTRSPAPAWINLEYLSAESWVVDHHALPSPHPRLPLTKYFFFPGYLSGTGGILAERDLASRRERFQRGETTAFWQQRDIPEPAADELRISMFAYENPAVAGLLDAWAAGQRAITCLIPEGRIVPQVVAWSGRPEFKPGDVYERGSLMLRILPFLGQDDYDRLLWACDINFVRGEDSCVRAQWAAKPMVWQAYPQPDNVHWAKLNALLERHVAGLHAAEAASLGRLWRAWNGIGGHQDMHRIWSEYLPCLEALTRHAAAWSETLAAAGNLADNLVEFVENRI